VKVLALSSYGGLGGSELTFAAFIRHRPADVDVKALVLAPGGLADLLAEQGTPAIVADGYVGRPTARDAVRFARALLPLLKRERPDVIWAMAQKAALLASPAAKRARVPIVWHKVDFSWDATLAVPTALGVDGVVGVSKAVVGALGPLRERRLLGTVGPPVTLDPALTASPDPERPALGTLGRLVPYKGAHLIIEAAARLRPRFPGIRVVLAGTPAPEYPDYPGRLEALTRELGMEDAVELPGFVPAEEVLPRLSVYVSATYRDEEGFGLEGLSGAMLEASWVGLPVVATRGGGTAEGLLDGKTGTLVAAESSEALADAIAPYLADPELAQRTGAVGRRFAQERFAPERASSRLFELLGRVAR
jgi:glycosyltransferase involved in cell wall biosynthesis